MDPAERGPRRRHPQQLWISPARRSGGDPSVSRSDSTTPARKVVSARTRATRWEPFPSASGPRREECVGEGETGRSRLRPLRHPGPETQRRDARLDRRRGLDVNPAGSRVLGEALRRSRSKRSSSATFGQVGRSQSTAVAAARAWSLLRVTEVGGRRRLSRPDRPREGCAHPHRGSSALWSLSRLGLGDDIDERGGNPAAPSPTATTGARSPPWRSRRETGRRVGRLFSSSVVGTSSHSIEPHPDDETERRVFIEADVAGLARRSSRQSRRLGGHGRERPVASCRTSAAG